MTVSSFPAFLWPFLLLIAAAFAVRLFRLKRNYYLGISLWSRWLPVAATGIYLATLTVNLFSEGGASDFGPLSLTSLFSTPEMIVLLCLGPIFLTRIGNFAGAVALSYVMEKMLMLPDATVTPAFFLMTSSTATIAVLSDRMPWLSIQGINHFAEKMREILLVALTIAALALIFAAIIKVHGFAHWVGSGFGIAFEAPLILLALVLLFVGWLSVALGFTRNFTIPLLSLPTLFVLAYVSDWPSELLIVPFVLTFALSLAAVERRLLRTRRSTGLSASVLATR